MSIVSGSLGAVMGADATESAAETSAAATRDAAQVAKDIYKETSTNLKPYLDYGTSYLTDMKKMLSGGYDMNESPSAQYALSQGTKTLNRQLAARGLSGSGQASTALGDLANSTAASDYQTRYNMLQNALQTGVAAATQTGNAGAQLSSNAANTANTLSNIYSNRGNQLSSLYGGLGGAAASTAGSALKAYDLYSKYNTGAETAETAEMFI